MLLKDVVLALDPAKVSVLAFLAERIFVVALPVAFFLAWDAFHFFSINFTKDMMKKYYW